MNITWSDEALLDLTNIQSYIQSDNKQAAAQVAIRLITYTEGQLSVFPRAGRVARVSDTFELVVPRLPYIITYRIKNQCIEIVRVYHTSLSWADDA